MIFKKLYYKKNAIKKLQVYKKFKDQKKIIYLLSPEHGNLGDQAIAIAIKKMLEDKYKDNMVFEFSLEEYTYLKKSISKNIGIKDPIYLHGGGNLGNLYINEEIQRRDVIKRFPENKITIMPQSISFTNDERGIREMEITKKIYNNHKNLNIICREEKSFKTAETLFQKNNLFFSPDSVLYLSDYYKKNTKRDGVLFALRRDKEKVVDDLKIVKIKKILMNLNEEATNQDTIIDKKININNRINEFDNILNSFSKSKLVVTDRFHGAIFSYITNTPCIVFKSLDHKISEGIKWFSNVEFIHYAENNENFEELVNYMLSMEVKGNNEVLKKELISTMKKLDT